MASILLRHILELFTFMIFWEKTEYKGYVRVTIQYILKHLWMSM